MIILLARTEVKPGRDRRTGFARLTETLLFIRLQRAEHRLGVCDKLLRSHRQPLGRVDLIEQALVDRIGQRDRVDRPLSFRIRPLPLDQLVKFALAVVARPD
ncbi:hypothetical protein SDC9_185877 [bioreactor metagenome]|uniref:Uncharacterized protein n=1 Tax=bioreactor metagenome TaxID=1076179 RepID=A0A645HSJ2_9ZZZZ